MSSQSESFPGTSPSKGTIRIAQVLSSVRGANGGLHLHPQGHRLVSAWCGEQSAVDFWSVDTSQHLQSIELDVELADVGTTVDPGLMPPGLESGPDGWPAHILPVVDSAMNVHGGHLVLAAGRGVRLLRFAADENQLLHQQTLRGHEQAVTRVAIDASGERVLSVDGTGQLILWSTVNAKSQHLLRISKTPYCVRFIWNNMLAMCGDDSGRIICWELEHGRRHLQFQAHHGAVESASFNSDSGVLLTVGSDSAARMWNLEEGRQIGGDMPHRGPIYDACFAYAGRFVVTCGADGHVAIWNSTDGDLLDWHFDSSPVYRLAFDRLNGTLFIAGARTIKALNVDWQRLREVDADARSTAILDISPADHAAIFSQPPPRPPVNYANQSPDAAPIGSVMAARQTTDLPFPDRSNLALQRPGAAAAPNPGIPAQPTPGPAGPGPAARPGAVTGRQSPIGGPRTGQYAPPGRVGGAVNRTFGAPAGTGGPPGGAFATRVMSALGGAAPSVGPTGVAAPGRPGHGALGGAPRAAGSTAPSGAPPLPGAAPPSPSLAAAVEAQRVTEEGGARATSYGIGKGEQPQSEVSAFFQPSNAPGSDRMSRFDDPPPHPGTDRRQGQPEPSPLDALDLDGPTAGRGPGGENLKRVFQGAQARRSAQSADLRRRVLYGLLLVVIAAVGARLGVFHYFSEITYPAAVAEEARRAHQVYDEAVDAADDELAAFVEQQQAQISQYRRAGTMVESELERVSRAADRRIERRRGEVEVVRRAAATELDQRLASIEEARRLAAGDIANLSSAGAALVFLLISLLVFGRKRANP